MPPDPGALGLSDSERRFFDLVPPTGEAVGNSWLRGQLGWEDELYWRTRDELEEKGFIIRGRGRGGSARRTAQYTEAAAPAAQPEAVKEAVEEAEAERSLYVPVAAALERNWCRDNVQGDLIVQITAAQGRRSTGGTWTRPDLTVLSVFSSPFLPGKFLRCITFEVKTAANFDILAIYEALAHRRFANEVYVFLVDRESEVCDTEGCARAVDEARAHGVGLISTSSPESYAGWRTHAEARPVVPDPVDTHEFISAQISQPNQEKLQRWAK